VTKWMKLFRTKLKHDAGEAKIQAKAKEAMAAKQERAESKAAKEEREEAVKLEKAKPAMAPKIDIPQGSASARPPAAAADPEAFASASVGLMAKLQPRRSAFRMKMNSFRLREKKKVANDTEATLRELFILGEVLGETGPSSSSSARAVPVIDLE